MALAAINVKPPRGAQISTCEAPKTTKVRKLFLIVPTLKNPVCGARKRIRKHLHLPFIHVEVSA